MKIAWCSAAAAAGVAGLVPTPVGHGPRYRPAPAAHGTCRAAPLDGGRRVHLELFANQRVVVVPAALGLRSARLEHGRVLAAGCRARLWTLDPSGVVRFAGPATLGDLFAVWGRPLGPRALVSFRGRVSVYVDGTRRSGDPRTVSLRDRGEIVLEVGGHVPPHASFRFPP